MAHWRESDYESHREQRRHLGCTPSSELQGCLAGFITRGKERPKDTKARPSVARTHLLFGQQMTMSRDDAVCHHSISIVSIQEAQTEPYGYKQSNCAVMPRKRGAIYPEMPTPPHPMLKQPQLTQTRLVPDPTLQATVGEALNPASAPTHVDSRPYKRPVSEVGKSADHIGGAAGRG